MARDPPSPPSAAASSSELRDLSLQPSHVRQGKITIIHPQLRDLILPLKRGHVLYPRGTTLEEQSWEPEPDVDEADDEGNDGPIKPSVSSGTTRTFANLSFTPNCLTARGNIMACGGQHGELYLTHLSTSTQSALQARFASSPPVKPFSLSVTLPTRSINNSLTILPCWPEEWKRKERDRRLSYFRGRRDREAEWKDHLDPERSSSEDEDEEEDEEGDEGIDDEYEGIDDGLELDSEMDEVEDLPSPSSSVATYPNTVPFRHAPRIPHLSPSQPIIELPSRRSASFSSHSHSQMQTHVHSHARPSSNRGSFSSSLDRSHIQYVTSIPHHRPPEFATTSSSAASSSSSIKRKRKEKRLQEPRLLVSNNDQTVKMFSIRRSPSSPSSSTRPLSPSDHSPGGHAAFPPDQSDRVRQLQRELQSARDTQADVRRLYERVVANRTTAPAPPPRFGSSFGWDGIAANEGLQAGEEALRNELERAREHLRLQQENFQREREDFERVIGMRVGGISLGGNQGGTHLGPAEERESRRLARVGGTRFKYAINHSSLSPDLKQMVSVGDSPEGDVYLFEVIDGGRDFRKIGVYNAATDSSFSTAWSKDGRKFAVASQDGQVTVWDHRSSRPLAIFYTSPAVTAPSFSSDLASSRLEQGWTSPRFANPNVILIDPVSGDAQSGSSTSGREAARVVKFSPEGSGRDLMVFTEENSNLHIVDAKTFNSHVVVPVPHVVPSPTVDPATLYRDRMGVEGGTWGIAGVGFDPTGDWLYSGTEKTIVEWDLRRVGGGEGGTWGMA